MRQVREARPGDPNFVPIDRYTPLHIGVGAGLAYLGFSFPTTLAISIGWELVERPLKRHAPAIFPNPTMDGPANSIMDVVANLAGWYLVKGRARK